jgi:hypothetical protein
MELFRASYYKAKGEYYSAESLLMLLVLQQQKMINGLIAKVSEYEKSQ